jgi:iron complex outermembrane recepter protein
MSVGPSNRQRWIAALGFCALFLPGSPVIAQQPEKSEPQAPAAEPSPPADERLKILEEITVTAQKREENIQEVPLSITTLNADQLLPLASGGADVKFLSGRVPSLLLESSFGRAFPRFYIRGLGNTDFDLNASQPVSMVVDEMVLENPIVKGMPLFDVQRVEVLRGPQGTLFGRNTPAGIVKFETRKPSRQFDGYARVSYGTYDNIDFKAAVGGGCRRRCPRAWPGSSSRSRTGSTTPSRARRTRWGASRPSPGGCSSSGSPPRSSRRC